jgi:CRP-like cAMP-binding protein
MKNILEIYLQTKLARNLLADILEEVEYKKGKELVSLKEKSSDIFFIKKGITRSYYTDSKGKPHTRFLFTAPQACASLASLILDNPSTMTHEALTDCIVLKGDYRKFKKLASTNIEISNLYSSLLENAFILMDERNRELASLDAKQLYLKLQKEKPQIIKSIPLNYIASYLNVTPVQLSRIRKELNKK